jgi:hypothetical protein
MSGAPPLPRSVPACQRDPDRWFDPHDRVQALAGCLGCPVRSWCAREALSCNASWGMWAGVWIDENHDAAAPFLRAIENGDPAEADRRRPVTGAATAPPSPRPAPLCRPAPSAPMRSVSAALLARSSGHCEVCAAGCRYGFDRAVSRRPAGASNESPSPAEVFAACQQCADTVAGLQPRLAAGSGYAVPPDRDPAAVPFHWRGARWVLLGRDGWLTEIGDHAQTA